MRIKTYQVYKTRVCTETGLTIKVYETQYADGYFTEGDILPELVTDTDIIKDKEPKI